MVGSGKKRKKEEKAKTQLKKPKTAPGKHLPKGTNETRTSFKVAKIVVPGQQQGEQAAAAGPRTNKKLSLKDVLGKIGHFSLAVRMDGLEGLKELVGGSAAAEVLLPNLPAVLGALMPLVQDRERKVRRLAAACLAPALALAPAASLQPLHALLAAHTCCALTHIDPRIQQDALAVLDSLLQHAPGFILAKADQVLPNCLDQISAKRQKAPGGQQAGGPHVAANLSDSMSSLQWRVNVLTRIDRILSVLAPQQADVVAGVRVQPWVAGEHHALPAPRPAGLALAGLAAVADGSALQQHLVTVLPLLLETWVEARATDARQRIKSSELAKEVAELLVCVAGVLDKLIRMLDDEIVEEVRERFGAEVSQHLLAPLPYSCPEVACGEANSLLASLALALHTALPAPVLRGALGGGAPPARLRLIKALLAQKEPEVEMRERCVAALVKLLATVDGEEREQVVQLLLTQAVRGGSEEVEGWVAGLPSHLVMCLGEGEEGREEVQVVLRCCLHLAKTANSALAAAFLAQMPSITGEQIHCSAPTHQPSWPMSSGQPLVLPANQN